MLFKAELLKIKQPVTYNINLVKINNILDKFKYKLIA